MTKFFKAISLEEAKEDVLSFAKRYELESEEIYFDEALGKYLSEDVIADENIPQFNKSRMDGYALKSKETIGASETMPAIFNMIGKVSIGKQVDFEINEEECAYVPTGAMIPIGADSIVMIENVDLITSDEILVNKAVAVGENITKIGEDIKKDSLVFKKGTKVTPFHIGVLASLGKTKVKVFKMPKVGIISTGDEIVSVNKRVLENTEIRDINTHCLKAQLKSLGCEIINTTVVKDDYESLKSAILENIKDVDFLIMSGGSSVGERDYMRKLLEELGNISFHGVRIKPGKPILFGDIKGKAFFGLPGNPVSCALALELIVSNFIYGLNKDEEAVIKGKLKVNTNIHSAPGKATVIMIDTKENKAEPILGRSSMMSMLSKAKGYIVIEENCEGIYKDDEVDINFLL